MGDRANIKFVEQNGGTMYFYTHGNGLDFMKDALKAALSKRDRWDDEQYLARIIFCEVVKDACDETTGFGLSTEIGDGEDQVIVVSVKDQTVAIGKKKWSFEEFISS
jgi:hypothetical protein